MTGPSPTDFLPGSKPSFIDSDGSFKRPASNFRKSLEVGGEHPPEKGEKLHAPTTARALTVATPCRVGRYHLYISYGCPWAHRTAIVRKLKGLEDFVGISVVSPLMGSLGWSFKKSAERDIEGTTDDALYGSTHMRDLYFRADPGYSGRFTVPVLWDTKLETIVNNESSEIIRVFNTAFNDQLPTDKAKIDLYPESLRTEIDELNHWVYETVNNGVYKAGFATTQTAYEDAVKPLFESLDRLEKILNGKEYLIGDKLTEADVRLFTTIVRFDVAYHGHFKCNLGTIRHNYPNLNLWLRRLYWNNPAFQDTTNFEHIKTGYYWSMKNINPTGIVPLGPIPLVEPL